MLKGIIPWGIICKHGAFFLGISWYFSTSGQEVEKRERNNKHYTFIY